ncbi:MAG: type II toxin-antitoxin system Phd/YefM family antitoxin [Leptospiraceae bacterium]|nr:type II toxin-antitoxin system Phd/YefM family antitoxin [Leptospiraceae bacterium]
MNLAEDIKPISYVKAHAAEIITKIGKTKRSLVITQNGEAKAVLTDIETYQKQQETMAMLKMIAIRERSIDENGGIPHDEMKGKLRGYWKKRLKEK